MARIGLQTWGSEGDVNPFLALATELVHRGHQVELAITSERERVYRAPPGVTIHRVGREISRLESVELLERCFASSSPMAQAKIISEEMFAPSLDAMADASMEMAKRNDILVRHHFVHSAQAAAESVGIPERSVMFVPDLIPCTEISPTSVPNVKYIRELGWWIAGKAIHSVFASGVAQTRERLGVPPIKDVLRRVWMSPQGTLVAVGKALWPTPKSWPANVAVTGFWQGPATREPVPEVVDHFLDEGAAPIYATFGSLFPRMGEGRRDTVRLLVDAAKQAGRRMIIQRFADIDEPATRRFTRDILFVERTPHAHVFPRCSLVIHHGGAGTTQTALAAGVPSVVIPHVADQFFWAPHLQRLGVAVMGPARRDVKASTLAQLIERSNAPSFAQSARSLGNQLAAENGPSCAVDHIENALRGQRSMSFGSPRTASTSS